MLTAYSPASQVGKFLRDNFIPQETFAGIVGVSTGALSEYLNGKRDLSNGLGESWLHTTEVMKDFMERSRPIPINWHPRLVKEFKKILHDFEHRQLLVSVVDIGPQSTVSNEVAKAAQDLAALTFGDQMMAVLTHKKD